MIANKPLVLALMDELEKMKAPLLAAVAEEVAEVKKEAEKKAEKKAAAAAARKEKQEKHVPAPAPPTPTPAVSAEEVKSAQAAAVRAVLELLYFSQVFDTTDKSTAHHTAAMERTAVIAHAHAKLGNPSAKVTDASLSALAEAGKRMTSRPAEVTLSHRDYLSRCHSDAMAFVEKYQAKADSIAHCLGEIMNTDYIRVVPMITQVNARAAEERARAAKE